MSEKVLCFSEKLLQGLGEPKKYSNDVQHYFFEILKQENLVFVDRDDAEQNPSYKQIIPYHIICANDRYFVYRRGKKGGENRLHSKLSLGIGGHINEDDKKDTTLGIATYANGAEREIKEEVKLPDEYRWWTLGVVYDDSDAVGRVHFGVIHLLDIGIENLEIVDEALDFDGWYTYDQLVANKEKFENWSQIVIDYFL